MFIYEILKSSVSMEKFVRSTFVRYLTVETCVQVQPCPNWLMCHSVRDLPSIIHSSLALFTSSHCSRPIHSITVASRSNNTTPLCRPSAAELSGNTTALLVRV